MATTTIRVNVPSDSSDLAHEITPTQIKQALDARTRGDNVEFVGVRGSTLLPSQNLSIDRSNKLLDYMISNNLPASQEGIGAAQVASGAYVLPPSFMSSFLSSGAANLFLPLVGGAIAGGFSGGAGAAGGAAGSTGVTAATAGGTVGDMAAMYQGAYGMSAADAMAAAEAASASGMTASQLASTFASTGTLTGSQIASITGNAGLANTANSVIQNIATQIPSGATNVGGGLLSKTITGADSSGGGLFGTGITGTQALSAGLGLLGSYQQGQSAQNAAQQSANAQIEAARIAAEASKFRPVGVTTRFGGSQFGYDAAGNLISAGYQLSPELKAQQDALMAMSGQALSQYQGTPSATAPMGQGAQTLFGLGQGYLATTPQEQAAKFMAEQQALLAPSREREMAALQNRLQAQGRLGLATGGTSTGLMASNPELEAFYNAQRMQDLQLAAQATQGGQQYATFGAGLLGTGGELQKSMYGTQQAAYAPYQTALGGATTLEQLGQTPLDIGTSLGSATTAASAAAGRATQQGMIGAAQTMQPANAYSPWGSLLTGAGQAVGQYGKPQQQQYRFDPFTGRKL